MRQLLSGLFCSYTQVQLPWSFATTMNRLNPTQNLVPNLFCSSCLPDKLIAPSLPAPTGSAHSTLNICKRDG